jgi:hypothetical protein
MPEMLSISLTVRFLCLNADAVYKVLILLLKSPAEISTNDLKTSSEATLTFSN